MRAETSPWIPRRRIRIAVGLTAVLAITGVVAGAWLPAAWLLLVPALGAAWAALVMLLIRRQLSPRGGAWEHRIHALVIARLELARDARASVLDIGCGDGGLLLALLGRAPDVRATGVDVWAPSWDYAQADCESRLAAAGLHATFRRMDAAQLALPDGTFDAVVSVMCFHEVRAAPGAGRGPCQALTEALRVLRPGGRFVFVDRFDAPADFDHPQLAAALGAATELRREPLVATLGVPWPLRSKRALGPVVVLTGRR